MTSLQEAIVVIVVGAIVSFTSWLVKRALDHHTIQDAKMHEAIANISTQMALTAQSHDAHNVAVVTAIDTLTSDVKDLTEDVVQTREEVAMLKGNQQALVNQFNLKYPITP